MAASKIQGIELSSIKNMNSIDVPHQWEVVYEVDFTAETPASWAGDGAGSQRTFGGINWIAGNTAYADSVSTTAADGLKLVITSGETSSRWYSTTQTGPIVLADLDDIVSSYDQDDTIAIQALCDFTVDTAGTDSGYFYAGVYVGDGNYGSSGGGLWYHNCWVMDSAGNDQGMTRYGGGTGVGAGDYYDITYSGTRPTFLEMIIWPATGWAASMGTNTTFPDPFSIGPPTGGSGRGYGNMELQVPGTRMGCVNWTDPAGQPTDTNCNDYSGGFPMVWPGRDSSTNNPGPNPQYTLRPGADTSYGSGNHVGLWAAYLTKSVRDSAITCAFSKFRVLRRNK